MASDRTFRLEVIRNFAILNISNHLRFLPSDVLLIATCFNVWEWILPCLGDLLSSPLWKLQDEDFMHLVKVKTLFLPALAGERS